MNKDYFLFHLYKTNTLLYVLLLQISKALNLAVFHHHKGVMTAWILLTLRCHLFISSFIIMSCRQHGHPWPSLATSPYLSSPPAGLQDYILCPHIVAVCKFVLVVLLLHMHMWGSIGVHRLWVRPCFSSSVPHVWFVLLRVLLSLIHITQCPHTTDKYLDFSDKIMPIYNTW